MKKWPSWNAILSQSTRPAPVPALRQKSADGTPEVSAVKVPYEGSRSAIVSGRSPMPSAEAPISSVPGPSKSWDVQTGSPDPLGAPVKKMTEAGTEITPRIGEAGIGKEEVSQAGVQQSADATGRFCRHCGAAMESGSAICGDCGTHQIRPDRRNISLSELIDEAMATRFCTQCGTRVTEGKHFCHNCGQHIGKLSSEAPGGPAPAPRLTSPEVEQAQTQLNSDGHDGLRGPANSGRRSTISLTPVDMLSIQHAIDLYEKNFQHQPSPSAELALAWLASRRGHPGWRHGIASPVKRLMTLPRRDRSVAAASKPQRVAEETPRHALWRHPITLAGGATVVVVAAALITSLHINNRQGSSVPSVTGDARQRASLTTDRETEEEEPSAAIAKESPSGRPAVNHSPSQDEDTSSVESSSTRADHDQAGVPDVAVPKSDSDAAIQKTLNDWAKAMNNNDVTLQMRYYSDRLDRYFLARNVTQQFVVQDKARFYRKGNHIVAFHIGNVTVNKQSPQQAAVSLVKHWEIANGLATKSGETHSRLWLTRRGTQWTITGEQDLIDQQPAPRGPGPAHIL